MRLKLDENIPHRLAGLLAQMGHDVDTVIEEGLNGQTDEVIWKAVKENDRFLITQDLDFSDTRLFTPGTHAGLLLLRLREPGRENLFRRVLTAFQDENVETWQGCFAGFTDHKLRILHPPK